MITINDEGEILCNYHNCMYLDGKLCHGGLYQCPNIIERAQACLNDALTDYEELKKQTPYGDEYYSDLAWYEQRIQEYKQITNQLQPKEITTMNDATNDNTNNIIYGICENTHLGTFTIANNLSYEEAMDKLEKLITAAKKNGTYFGNRYSLTYRKQ